MSDQERTRITRVEDADESGNPIAGTRRYAASVASPTKEKPNTSRTRKERSRRESSSPVTSGLTDSDSTVHPSIDRRDSRSRPNKERPSSSSSRKAVVAAMRPSQPKHSKTSPILHTSSRHRDDASYYGVNTAPTVTTAATRPRAHTSNPRPQSYYGASSRPPPANARWYAQQPAPPPLQGASYPPPMWASPGSVGFPSASPMTQHPPQGDYFQRPLETRFSTSRPQSAMGFRPRTVSYDDFEQENDRSLARRSSQHRKAYPDEDARRAMPPPPRPSTTRPTTLAFRPPPPPVSQHRRSVGFDDGDLTGGDPSLYRDVGALQSRDYTVARRARRPSVGAATVTYDLGSYQAEVASGGSRRNSYYGSQSLSSNGNYEDKVRQAKAYQQDVDGGPTAPLTAEALRRASKTGGSSRSTRSSGSHDESEYRQSATTRTTRSSANEEDVTIRVKGATVLKVGGADIQCEDGAEINISSNRPLGYRGGSDKSSYMDQDDRRTRIDRPATRTRASSQAGSYSRTMPRYDALLGYDPYQYQYHQQIPPYPAYPGTRPAGDWV